MLNEVQMEAAELKKGTDSKKFCIEAIRSSDKDVQFYTSSSSVTVFDQLLEYLSLEWKVSMW